MCLCVCMGLMSTPPCGGPGQRLSQPNIDWTVLFNLYFDAVIAASMSKYPGVGVKLLLVNIPFQL